MTNEEKAKELARDYFRRVQLGFVSTDTESAGFDCAMQMAKWKEQQMIGRALKHLQDVYTQFDITDTNGYRIDFEFFKYEFEKAMRTVKD